VLVDVLELVLVDVEVEVVDGVEHQLHMVGHMCRILA